MINSDLMWDNRGIDDKIKHCREKIEMLQVSAYGVHTLIPSDMPHGSGNPTRQEEMCCRVLEEQKRLKELILIKTEMEFVLGSIQNKRDMQILIDFFISGKTQNQIARSNGMTHQAIQKIVNRSLKSI